MLLASISGRRPLSARSLGGRGMEFTLFYRGRLGSNGGREEKHGLRRKLHPQLMRLWNQKPLIDFRELFDLSNSGSPLYLRRSVGAYDFVPLVSHKVHLIAEIDITMLRPEEPGSIVSQSGDLDNRLKTLLDALKIPEPEALPNNASPDESEKPFFCLLDDDKLVTRLNVGTDRLLDVPGDDPSEVVLLLRVTTKQTKVVIDTIGLA